MGFGPLALATLVLLAVAVCVSKPMPTNGGGKATHTGPRDADHERDHDYKKPEIGVKMNSKDTDANYSVSTVVSANTATAQGRYAANKASTTALAFIGENAVTTDLTTHRQRAMQRALIVFEEKPTTTAAPKTPDWKGTKTTVESGVTAIFNIKNCIESPTTENIVNAVKSTIDVLTIFLPQIGPFSSAIFGIINMFMPKQVGGLKT